MLEPEVIRGILLGTSILEKETRILSFLYSDSLLKIPFYGTVDAESIGNTAIFKEKVVFPGPVIYQELHVDDKIYFGKAERERIKRTQEIGEEKAGYRR